MGNNRAKKKECAEIKATWRNGYEHLLEFYKENHHTRVPRNYRCKDGYNLGTWVSYQRQIRRKGWERKTELTGEQVEMLDKLGFLWDGRGVWQQNWNNGYRHLQAYVKAKGNARVPRNYTCEDGYNLGTWLCTQRQRMTSDKYQPLTEAQEKKLNKLGIYPGRVNDHKWDAGYEHLKTYAEENGHVRVPRLYVCTDGFALGNWYHNQKAFLKKPDESLNARWKERKKKIKGLISK